jgi:DNA-binding NarL/FixJ family response regulator
LFSSRIEGAAARAGVGVMFVRNLQEIAQQLQETTPRILILNLDAAQGNLEALEEVVRGGSFQTVGYYSHVDTRLAEEAKRIGVGIVLPRSVFAARLGQILELSSG